MTTLTIGTMLFTGVLMLLADRLITKAGTSISLSDLTDPVDPNGESRLPEFLGDASGRLREDYTLRRAQY